MTLSVKDTLDNLEPVRMVGGPCNGMMITLVQLADETTYVLYKIEYGNRVYHFGMYKHLSKFTRNLFSSLGRNLIRNLHEGRIEYMDAFSVCYTSRAKNKSR